MADVVIDQTDQGCSPFVHRGQNEEELRAMRIKKPADLEQLVSLRLSGPRNPCRDGAASDAHKMCDSRNTKVRVCNELTKLG
jgi:hypothetical protein